jgi:hypothetical protein
MATRFDDVALFPSNSTTALFRAWVQFIEDTIVTTGGWVNTADTGQLNIASAAIPTATNQKSGYRVYRMNDALQATNPVFMRIDFGSGASINNPSIWITVGTGSDGAGVITGIRFNGGAQSSPTTGAISSNPSAVNRSYGSADSARLQLGMFIQSTVGLVLLFSIERTRNADGTLNGTGVIMAYRDAGASYLNVNQVILLNPTGAQPFKETPKYVISDANPSAFGSDVGVGVLIPLIGVAQPPGVGIVIVRAADFAAEAQFSMTIYGAARNYVQLNSFSVTQLTGQDSNARVCIRYD